MHGLATFTKVETSGVGDMDLANIRGLDSLDNFLSKLCNVEGHAVLEVKRIFESKEETARTIEHRHEAGKLFVFVLVTTRSSV